MPDLTSRTAVDDIRRHVTALFAAFLTGDRDALVGGRTEDWMGFQIPSTRLIRGRAEYAQAIDEVLPNLRVDRYEFLEFEVSFLGDVALVFYVARDYLAAPEATGRRTILVRSLDVYVKVDGRWSQAASNISSHPDYRA